MTLIGRSLAFLQGEGGRVGVHRRTSVGQLGQLTVPVFRCLGPSLGVDESVVKYVVMYVP